LIGQGNHEAEIDFQKLWLRTSHKPLLELFFEPFIRKIIKRGSFTTKGFRQVRKVNLGRTSAARGEGKDE